MSWRATSAHATAGEKDQSILNLSAQLATARAASLAAENRASGLSKALAVRAAAAVGRDSELSAAKKLAEDARAAARADKAAAVAAQDENDRLKDELLGLSELSSQVCAPVLNTTHQLT